MIVDLHNHTSRYSRGCSVLHPRELIQRACELSLDGVAITEHDYLWTQDEIEDLRKFSAGRNLTIFRGKEVAAGGIHLLVFNYFHTLPATLTASEVAAKVRAEGGIAILAHPFRYDSHVNDSPETMTHMINSFDAVEVLTPNHSNLAVERVMSLCATLSIPAVGGSDSHVVEDVGKYATVFPDSLRNEAELSNAIRAGRCFPLSLTI